MNDFKKALRRLTQTDDEVYSVVGEVTKVDKERRVCVVKPLNGDAEILGVRLQADESKRTGTVVFPKVGTNVMVTFTAQNSGFISLYSAFETVESQVGQLKIVVNTEGVHLEKNGQNIKSVFEDMIDETSAVYDFLSELKIITPAGIGTLSLEMLPKIIAKKQKLATLKQQLGQILT